MIFNLYQHSTDLFIHNLV